MIMSQGEKTWKTKSGTVVPIKDMSNSHLLRVYVYLRDWRVKYFELMGHPPGKCTKGEWKDLPKTEWEKLKPAIIAEIELRGLKGMDGKPFC